MPDGCPLRVHLEKAAEGGDVEAEWRLENPPPLPVHAGHVWNWWVDISRDRQAGAMGLCKITRHDIARWERDEGIRLERWERKLIRDIDDEYVAMMTPKPDDKSGRGPGSHYVS